jgi:hypothetical protein
MLTLCKALLSPVLLIQACWLRRTALRLPEAAGPRSGVEGGAAQSARLRILVVGDSSAAGVGVEKQSEALARPVAKLLATRTGRPVVWQLVAKSGVKHEALELLSHAELGPADFLVTALGTNDVTSQRAPAQFVADYATPGRGSTPPHGCGWLGRNGVAAIAYPPRRASSFTLVSRPLCRPPGPSAESVGRSGRVGPLCIAAMGREAEGDGARPLSPRARTISRLGGACHRTNRGVVGS